MQYCHMENINATTQSVPLRDFIKGREWGKLNGWEDDLAHLLKEVQFKTFCLPEKTRRIPAKTLMQLLTTTFKHTVSDRA